MNRPSTAAQRSTSAETSEQSNLADVVEDAVVEQPWIERLTRVGWYAKGVVYVLFGAAALTVARHAADQDVNASPEGALGRVARASGGRPLLVVLGVGLALYALWRLISVAALRGTSVHDWANRVGYVFSGIFYAVLAVASLSAAAVDDRPDESGTVERLSRTALESSVGRWLLMVAGAVVVFVGCYFVVKAVKGKYADNLRGVQREFRANRGGSRLIWLLGRVGWTARGVVTALIGWFIIQAAWTFDPDKAHGFDGALRDLARHSWGAAIVVAVAIGLEVYGLYCIASAGRRDVTDPSAVRPTSSEPQELS